MFLPAGVFHRAPAPPGRPLLYSPWHPALSSCGWGGHLLMEPTDAATYRLVRTLITEAAIAAWSHPQGAGAFRRLVAINNQLAAEQRSRIEQASDHRPPEVPDQAE